VLGGVPVSGGYTLCGCSFHIRGSYTGRCHFHKMSNRNEMCPLGFTHQIAESQLSRWFYGTRQNRALKIVTEEFVAELSYTLAIPISLDSSREVAMNESSFGQLSTVTSASANYPVFLSVFRLCYLWFWAMNPLGLPRKQLYIMLKRLKAVSIPGQDICMHLTR
jgi:hypothetical protein